MSFTWIPLYSEIARKVLEFQDKQSELLSLLGQLKTDGVNVIALTDRDKSENQIPLAEIDPFTFFATFNRTGLESGRQKILARIKEAWQLTLPVPEDFDGIPIADARNSWFFAFFASRNPNDIPTLWRAAKEGIEKDWRTYDRTLFDEVLEIKQMGLTKLSVGLFWLNPRGFLPCDKNTRDYFAQIGVVEDDKTASGYFSWMEKAVAIAGDGFPQLSHDAYSADKGAPGISYWWLNANPTIWDFQDAAIGSSQTYNSRNEQGNKRQKFKYFSVVKPGDILLGYSTTPNKEIVAACKVTKALHPTASGDAIEFQIVEKFRVPVSWTELQSLPALSQCEPLINNMGSLFRVTEDEYIVIRELIDKRNDPPVEVPEYTMADAVKDLFMDEARLNAILSHLKRKKAIILQGPPGVGKTFIAKRLAYALMEQGDESRIEMVQFHPSYSYEDFVQGYRPTKASGLVLCDGVFHRFARRARHDPERKWVFVIDEINRGNLAKIFGELLMLLEADKRGSKHAIPLTYSEDTRETFDFPANVYVIGTMNTADRSLAMVDYALRRRFAFVTLEPEFKSPAFADWLTERKASKELIQRIRDRVKVVNDVIMKATDLGARFWIGHSFFCPPDGREADESWYQEVIDGEIRPLLEEYFDNPEDVKKLVADLSAQGTGP